MKHLPAVLALSFLTACSQQSDPATGLAAAAGPSGAAGSSASEPAAAGQTGDSAAPAATPAGTALEAAAGAADAGLKAAGGAAAGAAGALGGLASNLTGGGSANLGALGDLDLGALEGLAPEALATKGREAVQAIAAQLGSIQDLPGAEAVVKAVEPWLEKLGALEDSLGGVLPESATLAGAIDALKARFDPTGEVMQTLEPLLAKLQALIG
jgi:hypothetical protein